LEAVSDSWTRRYRQQNFQAWASPLGKTYDPVGKTEMHTPKLIRRSLALELDDEIATEADYEPSIELPASAKSRKRREKTSSLIQSEIRSGKNEQHLLSEHLNCFRQQVKSPVRCGSSCLEQLSRVADTNSSVKANTRWRKGMNTVGLFNFRGRRHNRPFTTTHQLNSTAKCKNDTELVSYKIQLRYLYWLLENISERVKCRPPSTLERSRIDIDFPDYIHAEGCWNTFMSSGKRLMTRAHLNIILNNESLIRQSDVNHVEPGSKKSVISMKEKLRSYDLTRSGRLRTKQEALHDVRSRTDYQVMKKMRSSASHFTERTKRNEKEKAAGKWLVKIKNKFSREQLDFLRSELGDLAHVKIPKSLSAQEDFFRTLRVLELHEIQDPEMKASIEFVRDMLCIDEVTFDAWFDGRQLELSPSGDYEFPTLEQ